MKTITVVLPLAVLCCLASAAQSDEPDALVDANGNVVERSGKPDGAVYSVYDSDGNLIGTRDAKGRFTELRAEEETSE